jgi:hypothetical protein
LDVVIVAILVAAFALLVCAHATVVVGLLIRTPRHHGLLALVFPPLAPYWGLRQGLRVRGFIWLAALALYALARIAAAF